MTALPIALRQRLRRRIVLHAGVAAALAPARPAFAAQTSPSSQRAVPDDVSSAAVPMQFPRDHGSHPEFNTEWWYVTGWAQVAQRTVGFQVTFFRSRVAATQGMASRFAAKQLMFAHAAVTDVQTGRLWHDQRIARSGFGMAQTSEQDTDVRLRDWSLRRTSDNIYQTRIDAEGFALDLRFDPTQPVLLQGNQGISSKGPLPDNISHYYSLPQLAVSGRIRIGTQPVLEVAASQALPRQAGAWLDREWSNGYLHPDAAGWDWIGMNFDDGGALMAFRIRDRVGNAFWDGGAYRSASGVLQIFEHGQTRWQPLRHWTSAASRAVYPVAWALDTPAGAFRIEALADNQELDSSRSTGAIYWEGLSDLNAAANGARVGRGYLEMTGYAGALRM